MFAAPGAGAETTVVGRARLQRMRWPHNELQWLQWIVALAGACLLLPPPLDAQRFELESLSREYRDFFEELDPVEIGIAHVKLSSPGHRLQVHRHEIDAERLPDGSVEVHLSLDVEGEGDLVADVSISRIQTELEEHLIVPRQALEVTGRARIEEASDGYLITLLSSQRAVEVVIESNLARQLFSLCRQMALVLVSLDCDAIERALTRVSVPMPEPGTSFLLPFEELNAEDRRRLSPFVTGAR